MVLIWAVLGCNGPPSGSGEDAAPEDAAPEDAAAPDGMAGDAGSALDASADALVADAGCAPGEEMCSGACRSLDSDSANCGSCGHDCLGASCTAALCEAAEIGGISAGAWGALAVDDTHVYYVNSVDSTLHRRVKDASAPAEVVVAPGVMYGLRNPVLDDTYVYLTDFICCNFGGRMWRMSKATLALDPLGMWSSTGGPSMNLAFDGSQLYVGAAPPFEIYSFPETGGSATLVTPAPNVIMVGVDDANVYFTQQSPDNIAPGLLAKAPKGGGGPATPLYEVPLPATPLGLVVSANDVFLATTSLIGLMPETGGLYRISKATSVVTDVAVGPGVGAVAADASGIAWVEYSAPGRVWVAGLDGSGGVVRAMGYDRVLAVALDATYVYWMTSGNGMGTIPAHVYRVAR